MKNLAYISLLSLAFACTSSPDQQAATQRDDSTRVSEVKREEKTAEAPGPAEQEQISEISAYRDQVEERLPKLQRTELDLKGEREQIRQKWAKLHAYRDKDQLVRIKLYPHPGISKRTEEFYYRNGALALVFIEDNGLEAEGRNASRKGKTYWFSGGKLLQEANETGEAETSSQEADAVRLLQEGQEFYQLAQDRK